MDFISGEVNIEVSGATDDYPLPARLSRKIEAAVCDVLERDDPFHGPDSDASADTPRTPDDRPIDDISAVDKCESCGVTPAPIILSNGDWECYNCGDDPNEPRKVMCDGGWSGGWNYQSYGDGSVMDLARTHGYLSPERLERYEYPGDIDWQTVTTVDQLGQVAVLARMQATDEWDSVAIGTMDPPAHADWDRPALLLALGDPAEHGAFGFSPRLDELGEWFRRDEWEVGLGAVLYNDRHDAPDRRDLYHVTGRFESADGVERRYQVQDGTHTTEMWYHAEDLLADFAPAGWTWPTSRKPTYHLTRNCGVEDATDRMQAARTERDP